MGRPVWSKHMSLAFATIHAYASYKHSNNLICREVESTYQAFDKYDWKSFLTRSSNALLPALNVLSKSNRLHGLNKEFIFLAIPGGSKWYLKLVGLLIQIFIRRNIWCSSEIVTLMISILHISFKLDIYLFRRCAIFLLVNFRNQWQTIRCAYMLRCIEKLSFKISLQRIRVYHSKCNGLM